MFSSPVFRGISDPLTPFQATSNVTLVLRRGRGVRSRLCQRIEAPKQMYLFRLSHPGCMFEDLLKNENQ